MEIQREGCYEPETAEALQNAYSETGSAAQAVLKAAAKAMEFEASEYDERVTDAVLETAHEALFASLLVVYRGPRNAFETWCENHQYSVDLAGSDSVESVAWHPVALNETVVAASYQHEPEAAAATVRRRAFGQCYRQQLQG